MNHSFLFFLFLVLLIMIATTIDVLSWSKILRMRIVRTRQRIQMISMEMFNKRSAEDRKNQ